ncbi:hypothetical protein BYT27DRAFT_6364543 [Phlegmacium glaucopus]|nr:hypothetical protein BYT27DRAFT_6364543 [Phlegmacium glaucopus]
MTPRAKALQLSQYEAIATSPLHRLLFEQFSLHTRVFLNYIDKLRGSERDEALQRALGITAPEIDDQLHPPKLN